MGILMSLTLNGWYISPKLLFVAFQAAEQAGILRRHMKMIEPAGGNTSGKHGTEMEALQSQRKFENGRYLKIVLIPPFFWLGAP